MNINLSFESTEEFGLFICSTAALDLRLLDQPAVNLGRFLPHKAYWPFMERVHEVCVVDVIYEVTLDNAESQSVDCRVVNYMVNDVQAKADNIWILTADGREIKGSVSVREYIETLPDNFGLRAGWRTDYFSLVFRRK